MKEFDPKEKLLEIESKIKYFEAEQERNPSRAISKILLQLKATQGILKEMVD